MSRIIVGQVLAGTGPDLQGSGLTREQVRHLYEGLQESGFSSVEHDLTRSPGCRIFNLRLVETGNELVIQGDVEVLDESEYRRFGGFSVGFPGRTVSLGKGTPCIEIQLNQSQFDINIVARSLEGRLPADCSLHVTERIQKGLNAIDVLIIVVLLGSAQIIKGFLNRAGADLYQFLKELRASGAASRPARLQIAGTIERHGQPLTFLFALDKDLSAEDFARVDPMSLFDPARIPDELQEVQRIVGTIEPGPRMIFRFAVLRDGSRVDLPQ